MHDREDSATQSDSSSGGSSAETGYPFEVHYRPQQAELGLGVGVASSSVDALAPISIEEVC